MTDANKWPREQNEWTLQMVQWENEPINDITIGEILYKHIMAWRRPEIKEASTNEYLKCIVKQTKQEAWHSLDM